VSKPVAVSARISASALAASSAEATTRTSPSKRRIGSALISSREIKRGCPDMDQTWFEWVIDGSARCA
jgi:hypothetical protein